jgi:hypothetical protein
MNVHSIPAINAALNALATVLMTAGFYLSVARKFELTAPACFPPELFRPCFSSVTSRTK